MFIATFGFLTYALPILALLLRIGGKMIFTDER